MAVILAPLPVADSSNPAVSSSTTHTWAAAEAGAEGGEEEEEGDSEATTTPGATTRRVSAVRVCTSFQRSYDSSSNNSSAVAELTTIPTYRYIDEGVR